MGYVRDRQTPAFCLRYKTDRKKSRFRYDALRYKGIYEKAVAGYPYGQESLQAPRMRDLPI